ncbi:hypothetical protein HW555_013335 [Spodoptera exigua]|uniref:Uncharacterized protein n=1 Tax=Spodoptera exigua TaxID=7107 RepID=A0A835G4Y1_SPOEX|nr:hypothetical protein HW555_013335 [Spodoptera exigua]
MGKEENKENRIEYLPSSAKNRKNVSDSFLSLSEQKLELVKLQKLSLEMDIEHKKNVQINKYSSLKSW